MLIFIDITTKVCYFTYRFYSISFTVGFTRHLNSHKWLYDKYSIEKTRSKPDGSTKVFRLNVTLAPNIIYPKEGVRLFLYYKN